MPTHSFNLEKIPQRLISRAQVLFNYKTKPIPNTDNCKQWALKNPSFQMEGYNGSLNQWISLLKYGCVEKQAVICPIVCGNTLCVNTDHLIIKHMEKDL